MNVLQKVQIYCDVDGVINIPPSPHTGNGYDSGALLTIKQNMGYGQTEDIEVEIRWRSFVIDFFREANADFHWLTSWDQNAVDVLDPLLQLNSKGFIPWSKKFSDFSQSFKGRAIEQLQQANPTPFIWIDDIATGNYKRLSFGKRKDILVIQTDPEIGIADEDMTQMAAFIKTNS